VNDNFEYLDGRINTVGQSITTLQANIQSVNSTLSAQIDTSISTTLQTLYPVGSIYIGTMSTCPLASLFGTWTLKSSGRVLQGSDETHEAGTTIAAGLPDHDHSYTALSRFGKDPSWSAPWWCSGDGGGGYATGTFTKASVSNSIYGNSDTVQPPAYVVNIWERTA